MKTSTRKLTFLALVLSLIVSFVGLITINAQKSVMASAEILGEGTVESPYIIDTLDTLKEFRDDVNGGNTYAGKYVKLNADIDLGNEEWTPIGNSTNKFQGVFDGGNNTVSNLLITGAKSNVGFFGFTTNGEIKNLTINNAKVSGYLNVGVVAGTPYTSKYTNITVSGHIEVNGSAYVGGVGGKNAYTNWTDITVDVDDTSYVYADSVIGGTAYRTYVGGVIGFIGEGKHSFTNVFSNVKVKGTVCDIGGITGIAHYGNKFENVIFEGSVVAPEGAEEVGGIAGVWHNQKGQTVSFTNCESTGSVTVGETTTTGSLVGGAYNANNEVADNSGSLVVDGEDVWTKPLCMIGQDGYDSFDAAINAANAMTGDVEIQIYGKVNYTSSTANLIGSYDSISFVGMNEVAEICITRTGGGAYLQSSKTVAFADLILSKANPKWENNAGHMGHHFSIQGGNATYTNCTFSNGACVSKGTATYIGCTFNNDVYYSLWIYDDAVVTVEDCVVNGVRGVKLYCEGDNNNDPKSVVIKDTTFTENLNQKAAIALTYGEKLELYGNTFNNPTPHIELNTSSDSGNNGTVIIAQDGLGNDISSSLTCVANGDPATAAKNGVLVTDANGNTKIYTTVDKASADAVEGYTVTLLHDSSETVKLAAGVILDKNNYTADNVSVKPYEAYIDGVAYDTLAKAFAQVKENQTIMITSDVCDEKIVLPATLKNVKVVAEDGVVVKNTIISSPALADVTAIDYDGVTFEGIVFENSRIYIQGWANDALSQTVSLKNFAIVDCEFYGIENASGNYAAVHFNVANTELVENLTFSGNVIDGITGGESAGLYADATGEVIIIENTIKNVSGSGMVIGLGGANATIDKNIISNWATSGNGRALRSSIISDSDLAVTNNNMSLENAPEEFIKVTGITDNTTVSVEENVLAGNTLSANGLILLQRVSGGTIDAEEILDSNVSVDNNQPHIKDGNWWIGAVDTGIPATGADGEQGIPGDDGLDGENGKDGITPIFKVADKFLHVSYDQGETWKIVGYVGGMKGDDGENGKNGIDGVTPKLRINEETNEWEVSYDNGETYQSLGVKATGADGQNGANGQDGKDGVNGQNGLNGQDGASAGSGASVVAIIIGVIAIILSGVAIASNFMKKRA